MNNNSNSNDQKGGEKICVLNTNELKCAPGRKYDKTNNTCFTIEELQNIAIQFNKQYNDSQIQYKNMGKKALLRELISKIKSKEGCENQSCWVNTSILNNIKDPMIKYGVLKPKGPWKNDGTWLSTDDINLVLNQYENKYKNFKFLGTVSYDFEDIPAYGLQNIELNKFLNNNINKIGLVINLDKYGENGSHWVSLYSDLNKKKIYFFDSLGKKPKNKIKEFIIKLYNQMNTNNYKSKYNNKKSIFRYNKNVHQLGPSECGVYSIRTIIHLLEGQTFTKVSNDIIRDEEIEKCRKIYFSGK